MDSALKTPAIVGGLRKAGVAEARFHIFLCMGPECCARAEAEVLWEHIKARTKNAAVVAMRTKADCFRICAGGPLIVVYPDGIWYAKVTPERFDRILTEHLEKGEPIAEWIIARNPLGSGS